ncbi:helix-turn-helix domain-containing protein [Amycolatopsis sp.]|uniref:helix-turn-helix domain-containing protein n=1 Tax=Amycolatopsis sp. TaxID=37632 RepID=UPI002E04B60D|nr:helix-turn-helix domain-containing protein [Amycolatopsis sp.]
MSQQLYSVDEVANLLGLHVRTVRNYVREGRLKATRIGKQYRISHEDLEELTGGQLEPPVRVTASRERHAEVSSIVQIDAIGPDDVHRLATLLMAATSHRGAEDEPLHIETSYDEVRGRLKVILLGSPSDTAKLLQMVDLVIGADR